ncbi:MAG: hypothetical protein AB1578_10395 [Thermodesulfobacteriota bacterium]
MRRIAGMLLLAAGLAPPAGAGPLAVTRYLVDGRVHVAVALRPDGSGGALTWLDTVSGRRGDVPLASRGPTLAVAASDSSCRAYLVGDFALVLESPPWSEDSPAPPALGIALE